MDNSIRKEISTSPIMVEKVETTEFSKELAESNENYHTIILSGDSIYSITNSTFLN